MTAVDERRPTSPAPPADPAIHKAATERKRRKRRALFRRDRTLLIMVLPALVLTALFAYVPIVGNAIAFQDYSPYVGMFENPWVGFANFERVLADEAFWSAVRNTLTITAFQLVFFFPVPIMMAILLQGLLSPRIRSLFQSIVYLPHFLSWVIVISIFQQILGGAGLLNQFLRDNGIEAVNLMTQPDTFLILVTSQALWKDAGWGIIVFLAALSAIDPSLYEAAAMDGAGRRKRMWHITLPALRPIIILLLILRLGDSLTVGFEQLLLQRDAVGAGAAEVLDTFVYYSGIQNGDWSYAAAAGLIKGVISVILVLGANKLAHLFGEAGVYQKS
jgi:putative aldouronate transport system permease protein